MMLIFFDIVEHTIYVFIDEFSFVGYSIGLCLSHFVEELKRCENFNLVLNWEKCHFMVRECIILGHRIFEKGIEVDRAKIEVVERLPPPISLKSITCFLGHAGFYRRFIKYFSKIAQPLCKLLELFLMKPV